MENAAALDPASFPCQTLKPKYQGIMSDLALSADSPSRSPLSQEVARRRTFAIISHPDAGKTTLTEKLLLFGGAINLAGQVKAKGERRNTRSDWMKIERERGISVVTSVMTFEFEGRVFNLLDTPGHEDFSEDTYRTLTAVDSAVMVIDAAKGIEARTRKLFEVCRLRDIPIITFINKMDRDSRDAFELLDDIEKTLALDTTTMTWPVGRGRDFLGTYDLATSGVRLLEGGGAKTGAAHERLRVQDPGQHGSKPPRSHRVRTAMLGETYPRHEGKAGAHRQEHEPVEPPVLFRTGSRAGR